jgi:hypothetical protein
MLEFVAYSARLQFVFHGDGRALTYSYLFYGGAVLAVIIGVSFRFMFMKNPDFDLNYRRPDRENTWLGVVLVLGLLFVLGFVGIYLAWRQRPSPAVYALRWSFESNRGVATEIGTGKSAGKFTVQN